MATPRIGLLGVGNWGRNHLRVLTELDVLVGAFDLHEGARSAIPAPLRADSLEALYARNLDALVIATPARSHSALAADALRRGLDVFVEKPLTLDEGEAERLVALAEAECRMLMVGHLTVYHPGIEALAALIKSGELGRLHYLYSHRLNLGVVRQEEDILWSFAPHDIAVLLSLLGEVPATVSATGGNYLRADRADVTVTHLEFRDGVRAHIFVSWLHPMKEHRLVALGARRMAVFTDGPEGGRLLLYDTVVDPKTGRPPEAPTNGVEHPFCWHEPLKAQMNAFITSLRTREEPRTGGRHGLEVLRVLTTAQESLARGGAPLPCRVEEAHP